MRGCMIAAIVALGLVPSTASAGGGRWPTWPSEVERVAAPLISVDRPSHDRDRAAAIVRLEVFATPVIEALIVDALKDPSTQVRREALRVCYLRRILGCIGPASAIWDEGVEPTLRVAALRVLALDPTPKHLDLLLDALRDPGDQMRAQAAQLIGWAPLSGQAAKDARRALVAKLSDTSSLVRRRAVEAIGLQGPGEGTLAVARLLEDPEPMVRAGGAEALGRIREPRSAPALLRALDGPNEAVVTRAIVDALARLPGKDVAKDLLRRLDDPPTGLSAFQVAEAIGNRPAPERLLVDGLVDRLREPDLRRPCLHALLMLGAPTRPTLEEALRRGMDPALELELRRLLIPLTPASKSVASAAFATTPRPRAEDQAGWIALMRAGRVQERIETGAALGTLGPAWLASAVATRIERASAVEPLRAWLVALASSPRTVEFRDGAWLPWARLLKWATDASQSPSDRCLALAAIGSAGGRATQRKVTRELQRFLDDSEPRVRACAATVAARVQPKGELSGVFLVDTDARVRVGAALGLAEAAALPRRARARIASVASRDPVPQVRAAARHALRRSAHSKRDSVPVFFAIEVRRNAWVEPPRWVEVEVGEDTVYLPATGVTSMRWGMAPGLKDGTAAKAVVDGL